jgi:transposase
MFVRKKPNRSGVISVQVIEKRNGSYHLLKTIGSSADPKVVELLYQKADLWIQATKRQLSIDFTNEQQVYETIFDSITAITVSGSSLLLGKLFDEIGFNAIDDELFKSLVIARLCYPASKLKTTEYLNRYQSIQIDVDKIYRYLDKLAGSQKSIVQRISYDHTLKVLNNTIQVVFYDVTTLYYEIDEEDDLRKTGFSKEGKHQHPQIVLGLLVSQNGYPLAYTIEEGNKFEGHTLLPVIDAFKKQYELADLVVIADSGLLSNDNIIELQTKGYRYILGARIKNERNDTQQKILELGLKNGDSRVIAKDDGVRLIISYSETRAKKDKSNRDKGIKKLEKLIKSGKLTKSQINNKGYNKYLKLKGDIQISIDNDKLKGAEKWDGLKGYLTNTVLSKEEIIENYNQLWQIEKAFRVAKTDLKIRPVFHYRKQRIEAHICIAFTAYKIYKELERQLKVKGSKLSPERAIEIGKSIFTIQAQMPINNKPYIKQIILNPEQQNLMKLFDL